MNIAPKKEEGYYVGSLRVAWILPYLMSRHKNPPHSYTL